jgi:hypothetical protein
MKNLLFFGKHDKEKDTTRNERIKELKEEIKKSKMQYKLLLLQVGSDNQGIVTDNIDLQVTTSFFDDSDYRNRSYDLDIIEQRIKLATIIEKQEKEKVELESQNSLLHNMKRML